MVKEITYKIASERVSRGSHFDLIISIISLDSPVRGGFKMDLQEGSEQMYRIGEFSKMSKTTVKALHYYDEIGLLKPEVVDDFTGYRFYTSKQLVLLHKIHSLRQIGLSMEEIKLVMAGTNTQYILQKRKVEILDQLSDLSTQLSRLEFILQYQEDYFMDYVAIVKELPECIVYAKKMVIPNYNAYFEVIPAIGGKVMEKYPHLKCAKPEYCFISYLDGEYKEKDIHVEFCEAVETLEEDFDDITFKKIDSVLAVSVMHKGPYSELSKAYAFVFDWIDKNQYTVADYPRENYIDGIWNKEDPKEWLTELQIPIIKK